MEFQICGDGHAVGLAEFHADDVPGTGGMRMTHHGAADAVVAADADDVAGSEAMASQKGNAMFGKVDHLHAGVTGLAGFVPPGNRQLTGSGFARF